jgi:hypothetical protein
LKLAQLAREPLEKSVQSGIVQLFRSCAGVVYSTSQGFRRDAGGTRMTPGLSDLVVFFPRIRTLLFFECKRRGETLRPSQEVFRDHCASCDVAFAWGGVEQAKTWLKARGLIA